MAMASHRPSLSYGGSPRASPFRRPESPASPSPLRQSTSNPAVTRPAMTTTPSRLGNDASSTTSSDSRTARNFTPSHRESESSPSRGANASPGFGGMLGNSRGSGMGENNALSRLQPAQVRELREGFQTLDRSGDGQVGREDVADMFAQLGLTSTPSELASFFPPGTPQTVALPAYLNSLATLLAKLSPSSELLSAFSAFEEDDIGQVDLAELKDSVLHTAPEPGEKPLTEREVDRVMNGFTGKRAFGKHSSMGMNKKGEVFRYQEFVAGISGGPSDGRAEKNSEG